MRHDTLGSCGHYRQTINGLEMALRHTEAKRSPSDDPARVQAVMTASVRGKLRRYDNLVAAGRLYEADQVAQSLATHDGLQIQ